MFGWFCRLLKFVVVVRFLLCVDCCVLLFRVACCCWSLIVGCWLFVVGCLLLVVCCLLFVGGVAV